MVEWVKQLHCSRVKRNEQSTLAATQMKLKCIILSGKNPISKGCVLSASICMTFYGICMCILFCCMTFWRRQKGRRENRSVPRVKAQGMSCIPRQWSQGCMCAKAHRTVHQVKANLAVCKFNHGFNKQSLKASHVSHFLP